MQPLNCNSFSFSPSFHLSVGVCFLSFFGKPNKYLSKLVLEFVSRSIVKIKLASLFLKHQSLWFDDQFMKERKYGTVVYCAYLQEEKREKKK